MTNDQTPLLSGTSTSNSSVRLLLNGSLVDTVLADPEGSWSYLFSSLAPGNYDLQAASVVDEAIGLLSDSFRFTISDPAA